MSNLNVCAMLITRSEGDVSSSIYIDGSGKTGAALNHSVVAGIRIIGIKSSVPELGKTLTRLAAEEGDRAHRIDINVAGVVAASCVTAVSEHGVGV